MSPNLEQELKTKIAEKLKQEFTPKLTLEEHLKSKIADKLKQELAPKLTLEEHLKSKIAEKLKQELTPKLTLEEHLKSKIAYKLTAQFQGITKHEDLNDVLRRKIKAQLFSKFQLKNKMPRFMFQNNTFIGQMKTRIQEALRRQFETDEFWVQKFISKYETAADPFKIHQDVYDDIRKIDVSLENKPQEYKDKHKPLIENYQTTRKQLIDLFTYEKLINYVNNEFNKEKYPGYYDSFVNMRNLATDNTHTSDEEIHRILLLVLSVSLSEGMLYMVKQMLEEKTPVSSDVLPPDKIQDIFYGQVLLLENEYPNYTDKTFLKYYDIWRTFYDQPSPETRKPSKLENKLSIRFPTPPLEKILKLKAMNDVCDRVDAVEKKLAEINQSKPENLDESAFCKKYYEKVEDKLAHERIIHKSDLALMKMVAEKGALKDKGRCKKEAIIQKIDKLMTTIDKDNMSANERAAIQATEAEKIKAEREAEMKKAANARKFLSPKLEQLADMLKPTKGPAGAASSGKGQFSQGNLTSPPSDSVTPNYETAAYDDAEAEEPKGVPMGSSTNPNASKAYADYPESAYVGNYFTYEFHEKQDPAKYESGPWIFKEKFFVPPTINREPETLIRTIELTGTEDKASIKITQGKESGSLMDSGTVNNDSMKTYYYAYFGKSRMIDAKQKKDVDTAMEYDEDNTHIIRMKDALFELIDRKNAKPEKPEEEEEKAGKPQSGVVKQIEETVEEIAEQITAITENIVGSNQIEETLKEEIAKKLTEVLSSGTGVGSIESELKQKIGEKLTEQLTPAGSIESELKDKIREKLMQQLTPAGSIESELKQKIREKLMQQLTPAGSIESELKQKIREKLMQQLTPAVDDIETTLKKQIGQKLTDTLKATVAPVVPTVVTPVAPVVPTVAPTVAPTPVATPPLTLKPFEEALKEAIAQALTKEFDHSISALTSP